MKWREQRGSRRNEKEEVKGDEGRKREEESKKEEGKRCNEERERGSEMVEGEWKR